jgi:hypothetical protein
VNVEAVLGQQHAGSVEDALAVAAGVGTLPHLDGGRGWCGGVLRVHVTSSGFDLSSQ